MESMFSILKKMAQHSLPFQAACDCGICTDCLEDACDIVCKKQHPRIGSAKDCSSDFQSSEDVKSLWCSICYHIQAYITRHLVGDKEVLSPKQGLVHDTNWESYFEMLRLLFVPGQIQRIHQQLLATSGILTLLQQSIQDLIQIKWPLHQKDSVSVELTGRKLQVNDRAFRAVHYLAVYEPAISACQGVLGPFRASFIHAVHVALGQAVEDLETRFGHRIHLPQNLYIMLNTGCYLENSLLNCASALSGKNEQAQLQQGPLLNFTGTAMLCSLQYPQKTLPQNMMNSNLTTNTIHNSHTNRPRGCASYNLPCSLVLHGHSFPQTPESGFHWLYAWPCLTAAEGTLSTLLASQAASQAKSHEVADEEQHLLNALLSILMLCDYHEGELTSVLVSVIENVVASLTTPILTSTREKQCLWLHQMWEEIEQHSKTSSNLQGESLLVELLSCTMAVVPTFPAPLLACLTRLGGLVAKVGVVSASNSAAMQVQQKMKCSKMHVIVYDLA
ncbi:hypothetical protein HPB49_005907 [Dermacentor silvarum]|uniref:Uncharacterized protein n=1 Tax=Dermacentor silvarum TaxID=543639 RepID=A0ACB8DAV3_DERSI|nr:hypothetical protein HPB49_005907 [Dermacentor silvarum]